MMSDTEKENILSAIRSGTDFIRKQLLSGNYGLSCLGKDGNPKFSHDKGHLFSAFHIVDALSDDLNEMERTIILMRILSEEYNGQWGYSPRGYYNETGNNPFFVDADDTAFALRTLRALDIYRSNDVLTNYKRICRYNDVYFPAFVTFITDMKGKKMETVPSSQNNLQIHPEVNANIYHVLLDSNNEHLISEQLIKASQQQDGSWSSFFILISIILYFSL